MRDPIRLLDQWAPPDDAGAPVGCLATTFTFESKFFEEDCLSRFLMMSSVASEGDAVSQAAARLEADERQREVHISVLTDRSSSVAKGSLAWDLLPLAVDGGCFHPKVTLLIWQHAVRVVIASANVTEAGYRKNIEIGLTVEITQRGTNASRSTLIQIADELDFYIGLVPDGLREPKDRAISTLEIFRERIEQYGTEASNSSSRLAAAPARPGGPRPLDALSQVWGGTKPLHATVVAPYWDSTGKMPFLSTVRGLLTGQPASERSLVAVVAADPFRGTYNAPSGIASVVDGIRAHKPQESSERRTLHAKALVLEGRDGVAALVGSSNATSAAHGLLPAARGNYEFNVWVWSPAGSKDANQLSEIIQCGAAVNAEDLDDEADDSDELAVPLLPLFFESCLLSVAAETIRLTFDETRPEPDDWSIASPVGSTLLRKAERVNSAPVVVVPNSTSELINWLEVHWTDKTGAHKATWPLNVADRSELPATELRTITIESILAALASGRPVFDAIEKAQRESSISGPPTNAELDPHKRVDDSEFLLKRARRHSYALWNLQKQLTRRAATPEALTCRLRGRFGPVRLAEGILESAREGRMAPDEAQFLLAELALTLGHADWSATELPKNDVSQRIRNEIGSLSSAATTISNDSPYLAKYVSDAMKEATTCLGN